MILTWNNTQPCQLGATLNIKEKNMSKEKDNTQDVRSIGDNSFAHEGRYEGMLEQAVKFLDRLSNYVRFAEHEISRAINGKNAVVRAVSVRDADSYIKKLVRETDS